MTPPPPPLARNRWLLPLIMLLIGLFIGYWVGKTMEQKAQAVGDCVSADSSTVVLTDVSQGQCTLRCKSCSWVQDR